MEFYDVGGGNDSHRHDQCGQRDNDLGATLNGTVNANNGSTTVTFQYGLTTVYGSTVTADQSPVTGNINTPVTKGITGLSANTTYHYRVVAASSAGTTNGGDQAFKTLVAPTPGSLIYLPLVLR